jgi:hypothetical protein
MTAGGGIDFKLSRQLSIRPVQAEYFVTRLPNGLNNRENNLRIGAGIILRFDQKQLDGCAYVRSRAMFVAMSCPRPQPIARMKSLVLLGLGYAIANIFFCACATRLSNCA